METKLKYITNAKRPKGGLIYEDITKNVPYKLVQLFTQTPHLDMMGRIVIHGNVNNSMKK